MRTTLVILVRLLGIFIEAVLTIFIIITTSFSTNLGITVYNIKILTSEYYITSKAT